MADFSSDFRTPLSINTWMSYFPIWSAAAYGLSLNPASSSWGTTNQGVYIPFSIPFEYVVRRFFWVNGATLTGSGCLAIYSSGGNQIYTTGAVATRTPANAIQFTTPANPIILKPDCYYLGLSFATTTGAVFGATGVTTAIARAMGILQQASVATLPASMTPIVPTTAIYPLAGFTRSLL